MPRRHAAEPSGIWQAQAARQHATKSIAGPFCIEIDTTVGSLAAGAQVTSFYRGESASSS